MTISQWLVASMKACANHSTISEARKIHSYLITMGLSSSTFLQNHLINMYSSLDSVDEAGLVFQQVSNPNVFTWNTMITGLCNGGKTCDARKMFDEMTVRDCVSWNVMMTGYLRTSEFDEVMRVFVWMLHDFRCQPNRFSLSCVLKACGGIGCVRLGKQLHGFGFKVGLLGDSHVEVSVLDMYVKCGDMKLAAKHFEQMDSPDMFCWNNMILGYSKLGGVDEALRMFYNMPELDLVSWNMIISVLSQHGWCKRALLMFTEMYKCGFRPDVVTYSSILSVCASASELEWGRRLHAQIIRLHAGSDVYIGSALLDMYAKCSSLVIAKRVFDKLSTHNAVSWTSMIAGFIQFGYIRKALVLFNQMRDEDVAPDQFTLATVLGACRSSKDIILGTELHCISTKLSLDCYVPVSNALLVMYAKCGSISSAESVFTTMTTRDIISWTSMVTVYSQAGNLTTAISYFNEMPKRNLVTWNSLLAAHVQHNHSEEALKLYLLLHREGNIKPDWVTFATLLSACATSSFLALGDMIIAQIVKAGFDSDTSVANGLVTMYSKCGRVQEAEQIFNSITNKDLVSWNSMMSGFAQNGFGRKVIEVFENMLHVGVFPDHISYVAILSGCSYAGLVQEGKLYFDSMTTKYNICPTIEHFACMVDLLGRAGFLAQAKHIIDGMPMQPNVAVWGALLGACKIHGHAKLAEYVMRKLLRLDSKDSGSYVVLANIYSNAGKLDDVAEVRKFMKDKGIRKNPGCSWIEANKTIHVFTSFDTKRHQIYDILKTLDDITKGIEKEEMLHFRILTMKCWK